MIKDFPSYKNISKYFLTNFCISFLCEYKQVGIDELSKCFKKHKGNFKDTFTHIYKVKPIWFEWEAYKFPVFIHENEKDLYTKDGKISFDIFLNAFLFLSGWQEHISTKKDTHGRFPYKGSLQQKHNFVETPIVNIYFELLYEVALKKEINIKRKIFKNPIIFTHDIDQLRSGWFENIQYEFQNFSLKSIWRIPKNILIKSFNLEDDYLKGMKRMLAIDIENDMKAISFFIPKKSHKDADFDLNKQKFLNVLNQTKKSQEIALHPGYSTFNNKLEYLSQLKEIEKLTNKKITKARQHFLQYDISFTPFIQEEIGIEIDYTLGFAEQYGFRNGLANPFHLFNFKENKAFKVLQVPLVFMDVSLINYSLNEEFESVENFLKITIKNFNSNFSILFHNSVFSNGKYDGFEDLYKNLLLLNKDCSLV